MNEVHSVEVIAVGDEILRGKVLNVNAQWIADKCWSYCFEVNRITVIGDSLDDISSVIGDAISRKPSLLFITGGLGPTPDDVTTEAIAKACNTTLKLNSEAFEAIKNLYLSRRPELWPARESIAKKMAKLPEGAIPLSNPVGIAPGMLIEYKNVKVIALPGVPREMKAIFELHVEPILEELAELRRFEANFKAYDVGEFDIMKVLKHASKAHKEIYLKVTGFEKEGERRLIKIYIATCATSAAEAQKRIIHIAKELSKCISRLGGSIKLYETTTTS